MRLFELTQAPRVPRNVRNNNPGNIKVSNDQWQGAVGNDGTFVQFDTPEMGARAMAKVLDNYQTKHGLYSLHSIIGRWAPSSDNNDPTSYAEYVAKSVGIDPNTKIDFSQDRELQARVMKKMIEIESGAGAEYFTPEIIRSGISLASGQPIQQPTSVTKVQPASKPTSINVANLPKPGTTKYNIKRGAKGQNVRELQTRLLALGYNLGKAGVDGDFGPATRRAVRRFQKDYGLYVDGVAGDQTIAAIRKISPVTSA